ncbi:MAG: N-acetylmuramoyl-L-alanine amidase [Nitriliruptorales bacterium]
MAEPIEAGARGPAVQDIQLRLQRLGFGCGDDELGIFERSTDAAVRTFQQQRGLASDGRVGNETWLALVEAGRTLGDRTLYLTEPMMRGDDVRELQRRLVRLGFDAGNVDGVFGPETAAALREFQLNVGLREDAIVGHDVVATLRRLHRQHQSASASVIREREALFRAPLRSTLAGARIMLDPGRGPDAPGRLSPTGHAEHQVCWEISNRVEGRLLARGASVTLARGPGTTPSPSERARLANSEDVELVLSIHLNALPSSNARGVAAYYFGEGAFVSEAGRRLAELAVDRVVERTGTLHCRAHPSTVALLRETRAPTVIVEPGFVTHPEEGRLLSDPTHQEEIADALSEAISEYLTGELPLHAAG